MRVSLKLHAIALISLLSLSLTSSGFASPIQFNTNSPQKVVAIDSDKMVLYTTFSGKNSETLKLSVIAPRGTKISVSEALTPNQNRIAATLNNSRNFFALKIIENNSTSISVGGRAVAAARGQTEHATIDCSAYTQAQIDGLITYYKTTYGIVTNQRAICGSTGPGTGNNDGTPPAAENSDNLADQYLSVIVKKNACAKDSRGRYIVKIALDFSKAKLNLLKSNEKFVNIVGERTSYSGKKASTLKPISEGKNAPDPLLLMTALGSFKGARGEVMSVFNWKGTKMNLIKKLPVDRYTFYRGLVLSTTPIKSVLGSNALATVELTDNSYQAYSICLRLSRTRQKMNGYP